MTAADGRRGDPDGQAAPDVSVVIVSYNTRALLDECLRSLQTSTGVTVETWVVDNAGEPEYRTVARLRLAGLLMEEKKYEDALRVLDDAKAPDFAALVADRRGDIFHAQGKVNSAKSSYLAAWQALDERVGYRRLVEAKLGALGVTPPAGAASAAGAPK